MQNPIKVKETELRTTSISAWAFSAAAIFSLSCSLASLILFGWQGWLSWTTLFVAFMMALFFGYLAIVVWASVRLDTQSLALLKQEAANEVVSAQKGVWPPPPNGLKEDQEPCVSTHGPYDIASCMNPNLHLYHATPLHYLPHIIASGALYAKSVTAGQGIRPRQSAVRRDKMLGLADWLHLATRPDTPLLRDKLARGYPHALFVFDRAAVLALPEVALLPYNTKAWHSKAAYIPVTDAAEKVEMLRCHDASHKFPSLEVLVHYGLDFTHLQKIAFASEDECQWIAELAVRLGWKMDMTLGVDAGFFSAYERGETWVETRDYLAACIESGHLLPPPDITFD